MADDNTLSGMSTKDLLKAAAIAEGYESVPVDIDTFINDPKYIGSIYGDGRVYPYWVDKLHKIYPNPLYSPYLEVAITGCIGAGKSVQMDTRLVTPNGYKLARDIVLGDTVLGTDGLFHKVLGIFPQGVRHTWKFKFNDRSEIITSDDHIWTVSKYGKRSPKYKMFDTTTADIVNGVCRGRRINGGKKGHLYVPVLEKPVKFDKNPKLPIPPYVLGMLIADGSLSSKNFSVAIAESDLVEKFKERLRSIDCSLVYRGRYCYYIKHPSWVYKAIEGMGLCVRAEDKHIPREYLFASVEDRLEFLRGYFDGDGCASRSSYDVITVSKQLSEDLAFLIRSLCGTVTMSEKDCSYVKDDIRVHCQHGYRLNFRMPEDYLPFSSVKHTSRHKVPQNSPYKTLISWEDCGEKECVCFSVDSPDHLFAVDGFTFTHNTTVSIIGVLYDLYRVTLLKDPHKKYKLIPTTPIVITLITATMDLAGAVMADQLIDVIGASPYFRSKLLPGKGDRIDEEMFPHHVGIAYGSRMRHSLGKAVIGAIIDEANFQNAVADQAVQNYNSIRRRMFSRFMTRGGEVPCRMWVVSSRNESTSFLESHIDAERSNPQVAIFEPAIWEVQAHKGIYSGKTFPVFTGSDVEQPKVLTSDSELDEYAGRIIHVPVEYRKDFENNLPGALQDLAGVATRNGVNLIYNVEALDKSMCLENCMTNDELQLSMTDNDQISDYYKGNLPKGKYYIHLDGGLKNDRFGFAMSRVTENISVTTVSAIDGGQVSKISPAVETPLVFGIKARPGSEVPFWKVRVFLAYLRSSGVNIAQITCDGYQSADMMQLLTKMGFNVKYASVDKTKDPYLKLSSNIILGLIKMPKSKILRIELMNLQNLPKKIDHPATVVVDGEQVAGGKDIADAVASSSYEAIGNSITLGAASLLNMQKATPTQMSMYQRQEYVMHNFFKMR